MKKSAGIVAYKIVNNQIYVFLAHMRGPYWEGINTWSILKGEHDKKEKIIDTAIREFQEECGQKTEFQNLFYLHTEKQKSRKLVVFFAGETDIDTTKCLSNTFPLEWPKGSGNIKDFPEMDEYKWFPIDDAIKIILPGQRKSLIKLEYYLKNVRN